MEKGLKINARFTGEGSEGSARRKRAGSKGSEGCGVAGATVLYAASRQGAIGKTCKPGCACGKCTPIPVGVHSEHDLKERSDAQIIVSRFSTGKHVTGFSGRVAPLRIQFLCQPLGGSLRYSYRLCHVAHCSASIVPPALPGWQAGAEQPVLTMEQLMKEMPCGALLCPRLRGKGGAVRHQKGAPQAAFILAPQAPTTTLTAEGRVKL